MHPLWSVQWCVHFLQTFWKVVPSLTECSWSILALFSPSSFRLPLLWSTNYYPWPSGDQKLESVVIYQRASPSKHALLTIQTSWSWKWLIHQCIQTTGWSSQVVNSIAWGVLYIILSFECMQHTYTYFFMHIYYTDYIFSHTDSGLSDIFECSMESPGQ